MINCSGINAARWGSNWSSIEDRGVPWFLEVIIHSFHETKRGSFFRLWCDGLSRHWANVCQTCGWSCAINLEVCWHWWQWNWHILPKNDPLVLSLVCHANLLWHDVEASQWCHSGQYTYQLVSTLVAAQTSQLPSPDARELHRAGNKTPHHFSSQMPIHEWDSRHKWEEVRTLVAPPSPHKQL